MGSYYFVVNMGSMLFGFILSLIIPLLILISFRPFVRKYEYARTKH